MKIELNTKMLILLIYLKEKSKQYNVKNEKSDLKKQLKQWENNHKKTS